MKRIITTLIFVLCITMTWSQRHSYTLTIPINVSALEGKCAYLADMDAESPNENNSVWATIEDGKIIIKGAISQPTMKMLFVEKKRVRAILIEPGEIVADQKMQYFTGTPLNDAYTSFQKESIKLQKDSLGLFLKELKAFVLKHNNDLAGLMALASCQEMLDLEDRLSLVSSCGEIIKDNPSIKKSIELWKNEYITRPGQKFVDLELTTEGNMQRLSDYVGKGYYVLVNFWAPWCKFSREEMPNLINIYNEYMDKGLRIIGVACGGIEESKKVIDEFSIPYPQMFTSQSGVESLYGIDKYPEIILFSPDGTIVDRWLRGDDLAKLLENLKI